MIKKSFYFCPKKLVYNQKIIQKKSKNYPKKSKKLSKKYS